MSDDGQTISILGVPLDLGAKNLGVDMGPQAYRYQNLVSVLEKAGFKVQDKGNIEPKDRAELSSDNPRLHYLKEIVRVNQLEAKAVQAELEKGHQVLVLGGDHSINLGAFSGAAGALGDEVGLIYFDAHGDMNTDETTLTGNIHGMHLASLLGHGASQLKDLHFAGTKLKKENLVHIGGSDFDKAEEDLISHEGLHAFTLFDLLKGGLAPLLAMIDNLASRTNNVWVSLDLDAIDQLYAPGAGMPNAKGLTFREVATMAEYVGRTCHVVGVDVVEYNPLQDQNYQTVELAIELVVKLLGRNYSWYTDYLARNEIA